MTSIQKYVKNQNGSTLTGFIIGLVIGLGIAVGVALVINKSSTPFTNKNTSADNSELTKAQMQDPNQPLYGAKATVSQAEKETNKPVVNPASTATSATSAASPTVTTAAKGTQTAPATDAIAQAAKTTLSDDKFIYFVQVGAFSAQNEADSARARLALMGIEAAVSEKNGEGSTMYRVRVGPFNNAEIMNKMRARLVENGMDVSVIKSAK